LAEICGNFESGNYHDSIVMIENDLQQCYNLNTRPASGFGDIILKFLSYKLCRENFWIQWSL